MSLTGALNELVDSLQMGHRRLGAKFCASQRSCSGGELRGELQVSVLSVMGGESTTEGVACASRINSVDLIGLAME